MGAHNAISPNDGCGDYCKIRQVFDPLKGYDIVLQSGQIHFLGLAF